MSLFEEEPPETFGEEDGATLGASLQGAAGDLGTTPWLAESVEWNDDYTELWDAPVKTAGLRWGV